MRRGSMGRAAAAFQLIPGSSSRDKGGPLFLPALYRVTWIDAVIDARSAPYLQAPD